MVGGHKVTLVDWQYDFVGMYQHFGEQIYKDDIDLNMDWGQTLVEIRNLLKQNLFTSKFCKGSLI